ncbi:RluA family pseudouridine synthase [Hutsoniella sourekii]|uniref:RluA family pseudouridine synthase n=1 Tax=Hutsoniella sourekii TaxID=87650 RepID=UPI00048633D9|nr:RluA family pseudouridine synthase [Hutsoniella sourekii]
MRFDWTYRGAEPIEIRRFLLDLDLPRRFVANVKAHGGVRLNDQFATVRYAIHPGDRLTLLAPDEEGHDTVPASDLPIEVVYEDRDLLVVNKPSDCVSIPSVQCPDISMANRVKGYYQRQGYADQVIHIVTRLDRDTSGLMLLAKHRLAHALLDRQLRAGRIHKFYQAISSRSDWEARGFIDAPIARSKDSLITRRVHPSGKSAQTEWWLEESLKESALLRLQLHTGRTHQIRVHLAHQGGPLVGDDLYGGPLYPKLNRQALHCCRLVLEQPFTGQAMDIQLSLPEDMQAWVDQDRIKEN